MQHIFWRKIKIIFIICICTFTSNAQIKDDPNLEDHDEKAIRFGIHVGVNQSHFNITKHSSFFNQQPMDSIVGVESLNSTGLMLAWLVNFRLSNHFDIRTTPFNITFTEKAMQYHLPFPDIIGGEDSFMTKKVQSISLVLPIQLKFSSDRIDNFKVYMMAGIKGEYDLASNAGAKKAENLIKLKKFDWGLEAGLGFHFYLPMVVLTPEIKMGWGLSNLHSRDTNFKYSSVLNKINSRTITFSLTIE